MAIKVGINENILITKLEVNDKGNLVITFKESGTSTNDAGEAMSAFEELMEEGMSSEASDFDVSIHIFPLKPKKTNGDELTMKQITDDIKRYKNLFLHILGAFQATQHVKFTKLYEGTGIKDSSTYEKGIRQEAILKKITSNLFEEFIELMKAHVGENSKPVRILFVRRSKDVHFVSLRTKFLADNPMIEPMDIPLAQSKLAFNDYEIKNGLDNPNAISRDTADKPGDDVPGSTSVPDDITFPDGLDEIPPFGSALPQ